MTAEKFRIPLQSKYYGTLNLLSSFNDTSLDFFIMASSVTGVLGSRGQSNYVAGNTFLDAIAQELTESHTHYISIDIGLVDGSSAYDDLTGMVRRQNLVRQGMPPITAADLDTFISYALSPQAREDQCRQALLGFNGRSIAEASEPPTTSWSPMFVHVRGEVNNKEEEEEDGIVASAETPRSIKEQLQDVAGSKNYVEEAKQLIVLAIKEGLGKLVAMEPSEIDEYMPLLDYGLDSLAAVDLRNWLKREIEASLRVTEILDAENISSLAIKIAEQFYVTAPA
jgi:aryl carrier-like protein